MVKAYLVWPPSVVAWSIVIPMFCCITVAKYIVVTLLKSAMKTLACCYQHYSLVPIGFLATPHSPSPEISLFFICLTAVGVYGGMGVWWTMPTTFLSGAAAAGAMGLINSSGNMGGWVGPYMLGFINGHTGSFTCGYYVMGACMFLCSSIDFDIT